jgi:hypothetical protein
MQIVSNNKATAQAQLRVAMLSMCDEDIREIFGRHHYTLEPLLMQLIRELRIQNDAASAIPEEKRAAQKRHLVDNMRHIMEEPA